tara:strand:+ start:249506 stop:250438 length:933 start_codon:yes stop_codon:yes gene_type:complete
MSGNFDRDASTILLCVSGSRSYGTATPASDYDYRGVCIPPAEYFLGYFAKFEQFTESEPDDKVVYDIRKFFTLAEKANPNVVESLFVRDCDIVELTTLGEVLLENRDLFLSQRVFSTFTGYAHAQLKRLQSHRGWLLNPPGDKPRREDYGLPEMSKADQRQLQGQIQSVESKNYEISDNMMYYITQEKAYSSALKNWHSYQQWKKNRNPDRAAMEAKFGFDGKHASHLIRLSRSCIEVLQGKGLRVYRDDAEELLAIRNGAWSYDRLMEESSKLYAEAKQALEVSPIPKQPDLTKLDNLCMRLVRKHLNL